MENRFKESDFNDIEEPKEVDESEQERIIYAGFKRRFSAALVDIILFSIVLFILFGGQSLISADILEAQKIEEDFKKGLITEEVAKVLLIKERKEIISGFILRSLSQMAVALLLLIPFWYYKGATPGKMMYSMKIVDKDSLGELSKRQILLRFLGYVLSFVMLFIGFMSIGFDKNKQGWHDKIANTIVIHTKDLDSQEEKDKKFKRDTYMVLAFIILFFIVKFFILDK